MDGWNTSIESDAPFELLKFFHDPTLLSAALSDIREFVGGGSGRQRIEPNAGGRLFTALLNYNLGLIWETHMEDVGVIDQREAVEDAARKSDIRMLALLNRPALGMEDLILERLRELKTDGQKDTTARV